MHQTSIFMFPFKKVWKRLILRSSSTWKYNKNGFVKQVIIDVGIIVSNVFVSAHKELVGKNIQILTKLTRIFAIGPKIRVDISCVGKYQARVMIKYAGQM